MGNKTLSPQLYNGDVVVTNKQRSYTVWHHHDECIGCCGSTTTGAYLKELLKDKVNRDDVRHYFLRRRGRYEYVYSDDYYIATENYKITDQFGTKHNRTRKITRYKNRRVLSDNIGEYILPNGASLHSSTSEKQPILQPPRVPYSEEGQIQPGLPSAPRLEDVDLSS
jgi:hypothetical protein